mmetsp:Transcript_23944/g.60553  ORF Transcript_23944/g.60553 Transcript_23944/m.60553 type:complete len:314 (-) Transcript_23944:98-1039(-)
MQLQVRTITNRLIELEAEDSATVGSLMQRASDVEHCNWAPGEYYKDVILVNRRDFARYAAVEQTLRQCGIIDGDVLELTIRFAAQPVVSKLMEPVGFYEVHPKPASTGVVLHSDISVQLINVVVEGRPCLVLRPAADGLDEEPVEAVQVFQPPNTLKLVPSAPLRENTTYAVTLDLTLDAAGMRVINHEGYDLSCVARGVDTVRPYHFVWHFQTGTTNALQRRGSSSSDEPSVLEAVHALLSRPLDSFSKKQLFALQTDLGSLLNRVGTSLRHIDTKIETLNHRLQEKARRLNVGTPPVPTDGSESAPKKLRH